jgi:hypothetical protein
MKPATVIARLLAGEDPGSLPLDTLPEPYAVIAEAVGGVDVAERPKVLASELAGLSSGARGIKRSIEAAAAALDTPKRKHRRKEKALGSRLSPERAAEIEALGVVSPDPEATSEIFTTLLGLDYDKRPLAEIRRRNAGRKTLRWLNENGGFVRDDVGGLWYYFRGGARPWDQVRVMQLESVEFSALLYSLSGANPASAHFAALLADCKTAALNAPIHPVVRHSAWNAETKELRVHSFDGCVYVLDGGPIRTEINGEAGVLFVASPLWQPYTPDFAGHGVLKWLTEDLPNWSSVPRVYALAFLAWILSLFFPELCPTRPLVGLVGEKGAGKSLLLRLLLRFLYGLTAEVTGVPEKPGDFVAMAAAAHLLCLDNLDSFVPWLRDRLARISTGAQDSYRRYYTNVDVGTVRYRCSVAITARTPDTLRRDDLADRLLVLLMDRIKEKDLELETELMTKVAAQRNAFWGEILTTLNQAVASIRAGGLTRKGSKLRLADWAALGRVFARDAGQEGLWDQLLKQMRSDQGDFLLKENLVVEGLSHWMMIEKNRGREVAARELYDELGELLFDGSKPPRDWPKSVIGFGRRLSGIRRELGNRYDVRWEEGTKAHNRGIILYRFWPKGCRPEQLELS